MFVDVRQKNVLVVGGGVVALRKASLLLEASARVFIGAPDLCAEAALMVGQGRLRHLPGRYDPGWLDGKCLVIAATGDRGVNARVARDGAGLNLWVNVVDDPELSSFHVPAIVDRSPVVVAVSSSGMAPVLARRLREKLESQLDPGLGALAQLAGRLRGQLRQKFDDVSQRRRFYSWMLDGPVAAYAGQSRMDLAERAALEALAGDGAWSRATMSFVDGGTHDPALLVLKGLRALGEADVVLYDEPGVNPAILALARRDAQRAEAGRGAGLWDQALAHLGSGRRLVYVHAGGRRADHLAFISRLQSRRICCEWIPGVPCPPGTREGPSGPMPDRPPR